ncbi:hypothetical protein B0H15DRAFT_834928 [Mycena belliarum]|uniref:Uncharacterized protein n=1 Tax=Mycena belliarum TaxID=1033014 RepID=A0AAD6U928_9AGAR|nr:hypothetical protein B0H15DRAFT_834928 [Mycena belliae]
MKVSHNMVFPPPSYSPLTPCPIYSTSPRSNEHTLQHTPLSGHARSTETFIRTEDSITVILNGQKENTGRLTFGRGALISGSLLLESAETVTNTGIRLQGILESLSLSHGYSQLKIVDQSASLYPKEGSQMRCPSASPFSLRFPLSFKNNMIHYPLPPSCDITLPGGAFLKCTYSLVVTVNVALHRSLPFFTKEKSLALELEYRQRTRPSRPRISEPSLFSTIKTCPEEWLQLSVDLTVGPDSLASDIYCDLFVPSIGVFGVTETVPFHLQLSGSIRSLRELLLRSRAVPDQSIRVYLLRQIVAAEAKIRTVLGEGSLLPLPPDIDGLPNVSLSKYEEAVSWEGEIQLRGITTPTFDVGTFRVMYLVAVELSPPEACSINRAHYGYPMKLTTDTWVTSADQYD